MLCPFWRVVDRIERIERPQCAADHFPDGAHSQGHGGPVAVLIGKSPRVVHPVASRLKTNQRKSWRGYGAMLGGIRG